MKARSNVHKSPVQSPDPSTSSFLERDLAHIINESRIAELTEELIVAKHSVEELVRVITDRDRIISELRGEIVSMQEREQQLRTQLSSSFTHEQVSSYVPDINRQARDRKI